MSEIEEHFLNGMRALYETILDIDDLSGDVERAALETQLKLDKCVEIDYDVDQIYLKGGHTLGHLLDLSQKSIDYIKALNFKAIKSYNDPLFISAHELSDLILASATRHGLTISFKPDNHNLTLKGCLINTSGRMTSVSEVENLFINKCDIQYLELLDRTQMVYKVYNEKTWQNIKIQNSSIAELSFGWEDMINITSQLRDEHFDILKYFNLKSNDIGKIKIEDPHHDILLLFDQIDKRFTIQRQYKYYKEFSFTNGWKVFVYSRFIMDPDKWKL